MAGELEELQAWYERQCDGDWEHDYGVTIGTLDNPGWRVEINLVGTPLERRAFPAVVDLAPAREWLHCEVADGKFRGNGGAPMLGPILRLFLDWARGAE
jgi:hypothetical protein